MIDTLSPTPSPAATAGALLRRPRLGFLGVGWIGLNRLEAVIKAGLAEVAAIADPSPEMTARAIALAPGAATGASLDELLEQDLDGIVVATPSALHAEQARAALARGIAVFCQKPLGRSEAETQEVIWAARRANRRIGVDLSYRHLAGVSRIRDLIATGELGRVYALEMAFHNAYGPDKEWFYRRELSGGGCVIDLGIHLVDLALWMLAFPAVAQVTSRLFVRGEPWLPEMNTVEDYALARLDLSSGATLQLACSWKLPAGQDAIIQATVYGTGGGACVQNVNGSFYEFEACRFRGTSREVLTTGREEWGGAALLDWVRKLGVSAAFDPEIEHLTSVAGALDRIYAANRVPD